MYRTILMDPPWYETGGGFWRKVWFKRRVIEDVPLSEALKIQKDAFRSQDNKRAKRMGIYIYDKNGKCVASQIGPYFKRHTNEAP